MFFRTCFFGRIGAVVVELSASLRRLEVVLIFD
jgi:hypothetical protein